MTLAELSEEVQDLRRHFPSRQIPFPNWLADEVGTALLRAKQMELKIRCDEKQIDELLRDIDSYQEEIWRLEEKVAEAESVKKKPSVA